MCANLGCILGTRHMADVDVDFLALSILLRAFPRGII